MKEQLAKAVTVFLNLNPKLLSYLEAASEMKTLEMLRQVGYLKKVGDGTVPDMVDMLKESSLSIGEQLKEIINLLHTKFSSTYQNSLTPPPKKTKKDMELLKEEDPELYNLIFTTDWLSNQEVIERFFSWSHSDPIIKKDVIKVTVDGVEQQLGGIPSDVDPSHYVGDVVKGAVLQGCNTITLENIQSLKNHYLG